MDEDVEFQLKKEVIIYKGGGNVQTNNQAETNNGHKMKEDVDMQYHHLQNKA